MSKLDNMTEHCTYILAAPCLLSAGVCESLIFMAWITAVVPSQERSNGNIIKVIWMFFDGKILYYCSYLSFTVATTAK